MRCERIGNDESQLIYYKGVKTKKHILKLMINSWSSPLRSKPPFFSVVVPPFWSKRSIYYVRICKVLSCNPIVDKTFEKSRNFFAVMDNTWMGETLVTVAQAAPIQLNLGM
eukprot:TRINITY_DN15039_c0_g1_i3.p1 TRINITY_DN15039_c0_g1~~TRINITY_DN15039_c0_g1_i3.p1  ORF type:complete len:111 (-),score=0.56 TRINITY_DN15039_c0_g1_i3:136-468(-)